MSILERLDDETGTSLDHTMGGPLTDAEFLGVISRFLTINNYEIVKPYLLRTQEKIEKNEVYDCIAAAKLRFVSLISKYTKEGSQVIMGIRKTGFRSMGRAWTHFVQIPSKRGGRWTATTIRGILTNEKYTGDVILQKTYTDSHFNRHTNYGEKNMYLVENHHEAIISHEDFEAVDAILNQRAKEKGIEKRNSKYLNRYSFSSKIICSECGSTFKRRIHSSGRREYIAWCCSKHISHITECSMQFIRDEDIKTAFVTMMNKLIFGHKFILRPLLNGLRSQNNAESFRRIEELETKIENNMEQSQMLTGLMAKGYLEPAMFNKEKNSLEAERESLFAEKEQLTHSVNGIFTKVEEVDRLLKFTTKSKMLTAYEDELFKNYVEKIIVFSREVVGFVLKCGITLKERLVN